MTTSSYLIVALALAASLVALTPTVARGGACAG